MIPNSKLNFKVEILDGQTSFIYTFQFQKMILTFLIFKKNPPKIILFFPPCVTLTDDEMEKV